MSATWSPVPQPHPQPGPSPQPAGGGRRLWPWVLGGAAVLFALFCMTLAAVLVLFFVLRSTPEDAVQAYETAIRENDCTAFQEVTLEEFRQAHDVEDCAAFTALPAPGEYHLTVEDVEKEEGVAKVTLTQTWEQDSVPYTAPAMMILVVESGTWKVADYGLTGEPTRA